MENKDWTHKNVKINDIRKISKLYVISIEDEEVNTPLFVNSKIFDERLRLYFLKDNVSREEILSVKWNMYITKGYYMKIVNDDITKYNMDPNKFYVSYLEIDGPLATFQSVYKEKED